MDYISFFEHATGHTPFPYQERLGTMDELPDVLEVPTGIGKTAAVVVSWLWRRHTNVPGTSRRLVYCLPMRTLVEQTRDSVKQWIEALGAVMENTPDVVTLMGGHRPRGWDIFPERDTIIIGTQDMLLSRALNRGYGMSRYRWPLHFGLLNNDAFWIMDEIQLMGVGLATSIQMQAFRGMMGHYGPSGSLWMSATVDSSWFATPDLHRDMRIMALSDDDRSMPTVATRLEAPKHIRSIPRSELDEAILVEAGTGPVLVVVNTVQRAQDLYHSIQKANDNILCTLVHSRYRRPDREERMADLRRIESSGGVAIATQVVEAGMDVSFRALFTELAPWPSLVQRFGRCNRRGEHPDARIFWMDMEEKEEAPYDPQEMEQARGVLVSMDSASISDLPSVPISMDFRHIIRRKDLIELFDTQPDMSGGMVDVTRFVRDAEGRDVALFWRDISGGMPEAKVPGRDELCRVPMSQVTAQADKVDMWRLDELDGDWRRVSKRSPLTPNDIVLVDAKKGLYSPEVGWSPTMRKVTVPEVTSEPAAEGSGYGGDRNFASDQIQTIDEHTRKVVERVRSISSSLDMGCRETRALRRAALWHDVGKGHPVFQSRLPVPLRNGRFLAKAPRGSWSIGTRRYFRHELASALAAMDSGEDDLVCYLVASHHGKVRMSLRSIPGEDKPDDERAFARGVWDGDEVPDIEVCGMSLGPSVMDLSVMAIGAQGGSWIHRAVTTRDEVGPFLLSYLEGLLKSADERASGGLP